MGHLDIKTVADDGAWFVWGYFKRPDKLKIHRILYLSEAFARENIEWVARRLQLDWQLSNLGYETSEFEEFDYLRYSDEGQTYDISDIFVPNWASACAVVENDWASGR